MNLCKQDLNNQTQEVRSKYKCLIIYGCFSRRQLVQKIEQDNMGLHWGTSNPMHLAYA